MATSTTSARHEKLKRKVAPQNAPDTEQVMQDTMGNLTTMQTDIQLEKLQTEISEKEIQQIQKKVDKMKKEEFKKLINTPIAELPSNEVEYLFKFWMARRINEMRKEKKLKTLKRDKRLERVAQDLVEQKIIDGKELPWDYPTEHESLDGLYIYERLKNAGLHPRYHHQPDGLDWWVGENIGRCGNLHYTTIEMLMQEVSNYQKHPGHARALFDPSVTKVGIGYKGGYLRLVQVFADI